MCAGFLGRICQASNGYIQVLVDSTTASPGSWTASTIRLVRPWCDETTPDQATAWHKVVRTSKLSARKLEAMATAELCLNNRTIASHSTPCWSHDGIWMVNNFLDCKELKPSSSRSIARLIVGGQDLRGGDPANGEHASTER